MARSQFQDIIPPDRRSIKKIPIPEGRSRLVRPAVTEEKYIEVKPEKEKREEIQEAEESPKSRRIKKPRSSRRFPWKIFIVLVIALAIIAGVIYFMSRVTGAWLTITPREAPVTVNASFIAIKATSTQTQNADFVYQTITISKDGKTSVAANGEEQADVKATGKIIIYNNYNASPQKLVANTRFATPEGLIFRITGAVTVPGKVGTTPGSVEATIIADKTGATYNVGQKDFTIPGFSGDPRYSKFFARSETPIQGGFSGMRKKVDDKEVLTAREKIHQELLANLINEAQKDIPAGYALPQNAYYVDYESQPDSEGTDNSVVIAERATLHGIIFSRTDLANSLIAKTGTSIPTPADVKDVSSLAFSTKLASSSQPWNADKLSFTLTGSTTLVSTVDTEKLKNDLAGKPRKSLNAILEGYPGIGKAEVTMRPFWKSVFPSDTSQISISVE